MQEPSASGLTPAQERTLALLRKPDQVTIFDADFIAELKHEAEAAMVSLSARLEGESLWISKSFLARVHGCEAFHLAPDDFEWSPASATGFVSHKAIELALNWRGDPVPAVVVDEALARLEDQADVRGAFIAGLCEADRAELRSRAVDRTTKFLQDFPPLPLSAHPVLEAAAKWRPPGTIELGGRADLVVGRPRGRESQLLIVDFKGGGRSLVHRHDLRFYALVQTLRHDVPPRLVVTYYLDYADCEVEPVTEGTLTAALLRTIEGIERHIELTREGRPPVKRPGVTCRWCPLVAECPQGQAWLTGGDPTDPTDPVSPSDLADPGLDSPG